MALVPCAVDAVRVHELTKQHVVVLRSPESVRVLPIWIGPDTAHAISLPLAGKTSERPLTHDLMVAAFGKLAVRVSRVVVRELAPGGEDPTLGVFRASAFLATSSGEIELDCRPSDALALAVRTGAPIFVAGEVFDRASVVPDQSGPHGEVF